MTRHARPSTVGDIVQQRRIDLAAAYRLLCRFSLNDSIDSHISVSLPGPQVLFFEPIRSGCGWSGNRLQSHHSRYQLRQFSMIPTGWVSIRPASPSPRHPYQ